MTYEQIGQRAGVTVCPACDLLTEEDHHQGRAEILICTVHWNRQRVTKAGIYEFLKLCRRAIYGGAGYSRWRRIYLESKYATTTAREMGIVIPSAASRADRLRVLAANPQLSSKDPIYRWAHEEKP